MQAKFLDLNEIQEYFEKHWKNKWEKNEFEKNSVKNLESVFVENYVIFKDFVTKYLANI